MIDAKQLDAIEQRGRDLRVFADGFADAGHPEIARHARVAAVDVANLTAELRAERDARISIQSQHAEALRLLANRAGAAARAAAA